MKFKRLNEEKLLEMARVGFFDEYEIYVMTNDPGYIPHFHIRDKNYTRKKISDLY